MSRNCISQPPVGASRRGVGNPGFEPNLHFPTPRLEPQGHSPREGNDTQPQGAEQEDKPSPHAPEQTAEERSGVQTGVPILGPPLNRADAAAVDDSTPLMHVPEAVPFQGMARSSLTSSMGTNSRSTLRYLSPMARGPEANEDTHPTHSPSSLDTTQETGG